MSKYYESAGKEVFDREIAEAVDLNTINIAVDTGFASVEADMDEVDKAVAQARKWAEDDQGTEPNPVGYSGDYSARANAEEAEAWSVGVGGVSTRSDGVTTITRSSKEYSEDTAADVVLTGIDVGLTGDDVVLTNADVVLTGLEVTKANEWAENPEGVPVETGPDQFSALHWSAKAQEISDSLEVYVYAFQNPIEITEDFTIATGNNAMSAGPTTVGGGVTITVPAGSTYTVV
jgi:hypothetical protein